MRITSKNLQRTYLRGLNSNIKKLSDSNERLNTGRRFSKLSQNVIDGSRALNVRDLLARNETFVGNAHQMQLQLSSQEEKMMQIQTLVQDAQELMTRGYSDTNSEDDKLIIGNQMDSIKESIIQIINSKSVDRYTFASLSNEKPISRVGSDVFFYGQNVDENDGSVFSKGSFNVSVGNMIDIGQPAIEVLGHGVDASGISNNLIKLLDQISTSISTSDKTHQGTFVTKMNDKANELLMRISDIGMKTNYLEATISRLSDEKISLTTQQNNLEAIDFEEEVIFNKSHEMAWQISLQLGTKVLPMSIFDFMR